MNDILILFHKIIVDIGSFNETHFGIFNDSEREVIRALFIEQCDSSPYRLLSLLSPEQKERVAVWACKRSSFATHELIAGLKKCIKYLEGIKYTVYPKKIDEKKRRKK